MGEPAVMNELADRTPFPCSKTYRSDDGDVEGHHQGAEAQSNGDGVQPVSVKGRFFAHWDSFLN